MYQEEDFLLISGIQHFVFCQRQWALIHLEQQWDENSRTTEGKIIHNNAHNGMIAEKRQNEIITRGMRVHSHELGFTGTCDVVEFHASAVGVSLAQYSGLWQPIPVEYKRGHSKASDCDRMQLCLQAMCLEEMLSATISEAYLYYAETHRREAVEISEGLRKTVRTLSDQMHALWKAGKTPRAKYTQSCQACSLMSQCLPKLPKKKEVDEYIESALQQI